MPGELAALATALCWAIAARLFLQLSSHFSALSLNFWKGSLTIVVLALANLYFDLSFAVEHQQLVMLLFSGAIGLGVGDTLFFKALQKIGDSQSLLIAETLAPILTAIVAIAWLGEWLSWQQWLAIAIIIFAVDMVIKLQKKHGVELFSWSGYSLAAGAALCQAIGAVLSRDVLIHSQISVTNAALLRLLAGTVIVACLIAIQGKAWLPNNYTSTRLWAKIALATLVGTLLALLLQMLALSLAKAAVVQTLFACSVLFSLALSAWFGRKIRLKTWLWSGLAMFGVALLLAFS